MEPNEANIDLLPVLRILSKTTGYIDQYDLQSKKNLLKEEKILWFYASWFKLEILIELPCCCCGVNNVLRVCYWLLSFVPQYYICLEVLVQIL